jgi:hypothetical protein
VLGVGDGFETGWCIPTKREELPVRAEQNTATEVLPERKDLVLPRCRHDLCGIVAGRVEVRADGTFHSLSIDVNAHMTRAA